MKIKLLSLLLASVFIITLFTSCGNDNGNKDADITSQSAVNSESDPVNAEITSYVDELAEENDFTGRTFTWIGSGGETPEYEEETGSIENDVLYFRQRDIEEKFGLDWINYISETYGDSTTHPTIENVLRDVMAGTQTYDLGYGSALGVTQVLLVNNALIDVSGNETIDFERDWWPSDLEETYEINGALFFLNGPIVSSNYEDTFCVMFDKSVALDYNIPSLYEYVKKGEWTFDRMFAAASVIPANENGSGVYRYAKPNGMAILIANGETVIKRDEKGSPYVDDNYTKELSDIFDKMSAVFGDDAQCINSKGELTKNFEDLNIKYGYGSYGDAFVKHGVLFYFGTTEEACDFRREDVDFGILPMPKKDENQENYISYAKNWLNVFVPKSTKDEGVTAVVIEAMAALGLKYIKPAYYDNILKNRSTYDRESKDMIDLIFDTKTYDIIDYLAPDGSQNDDSTFVNIIKSGIQESSSGISSKYKMQARVVNNSIHSVIQDIDKND